MRFLFGGVVDYIAGNKEAWEEAFENRDEAWGADVVARVRSQKFPFLEKPMVEAIEKYGVGGKSVAQFCSNNGRELLSIAAGGAAEGIGFDIAENQVAFANRAAAELGSPCRFVAKNILDIGGEYGGRFDMAVITIGALCWFKDLRPFFAVVAQSLKPKGILLINEQHPFANMLGAPGEDNYLPDYPLNACNSYFAKEWTENSGMFYVAKKVYRSKTFINYTHPLSDIMTDICRNGLAVVGFSEYEKDISGMFDKLDDRGFPLSYLLEAEKAER
jgi:SAM-dependent methyltransferase